MITIHPTIQVRIFPTEDTWSNYGSLLDFGSSNNLVLLDHTDTVMTMMMMMMMMVTVMTMMLVQVNCSAKEELWYHVPENVTLTRTTNTLTCQVSGWGSAYPLYSL